jgi:tetratricopeptide (TPR) repeat protein
MGLAASVEPAGRFSCIPENGRISQTPGAAEMRRGIILVFLIPCLTGCLWNIYRVKAQQYYDAGVQAEKAGDLEWAKENYLRALENAKRGHSPKSGISTATYDLGRVTGYLCEYDQAEKLLLQSLRMQEELTGPDSAAVTTRLFELARFYHDRGRYSESIPYYARGVSAVKTPNTGAGDPAGYAADLEDYADSLRKTGRTDKAEEFQARSGEIRNRHQGKSSDFLPMRYNRRCPDKQN